MKFSLTELMAKVTGLEARAEAAFKAELAELRGMITGSLTQAQNDLTTARASIESLGKQNTDLLAQVGDLTGKLSEANKDFLAVGDLLKAHLAQMDPEYKPGGAKASAALKDLVTAEINATNTALAKVGVKVNDLPAAPAASGTQAGGATAGARKFKTADEEIAARKAAAKTA